jgi:hypothetical protein
MTSPRGVLGRFDRVAAALATAAAASCTGPGNTGRTEPDASLVAAVPWLNGVLPEMDDAGNAVIPAQPVIPPIAAGLADPGSGKADCSALAGIEASSAWMHTFEPDAPGQIGVAVAWTAFDDLTKYAFHVPGDVGWYPGVAGNVNAAFGLPAANEGAPSCDGKPNQWSLHYRGGQFRNWGGGVSNVFTDRSNAMGDAPACTQDADICPPAPPTGATMDSAGLPLAAYDGGAYAESHTFVDVSAYEGVSFWARRGPESEDRMIVTITDSFTSDRLARQNQKYCRRLAACYTQCLNGSPCALDDPTSPDAVYRCHDPATGPLPKNALDGNDALLDLLYPRCGKSACTFRSSYPDFDFEGKDCRPYTFPAADISREYCFNAEDLPPPDRDEQCLDGWATTVQLTLDWQFHTVRFADMQQGGFGKKAPYFNLKAVDTIAFSFIVGWADVYIDNVSFYRRTN